ncbi:MAG: pyruvate, phosphate dikinase [bacterium TMED88]|nr:pyruvate, phosphate dikinase [Deltaproteobacteria bacterium]OUV25517.1 MAG: pyruvate, phosphate dikinase [bacterium TMED88]
MSVRKKKTPARRKVASPSPSGRRKKTAAKKKKAARSKASGAKRAGKPARRKSSARGKKASGQPSSSGATTRVVFYFGDGQADGRAEMKDTLGGKGANLAEMTNLGVPVPPGFTISTAVCSEYNARGRRLSKSVRADVLTALARVEQSRGRRFGDPESPLLVSVRSGARVSMPGMMDTVLNLGLNHETVEGLAALADERFAFDSYRRFIQMYGDVVLGVPHERFEHLLETRKLRLGVDLDTELEGNDLRGLVREYLEIVEEHTGRPFPQDPEQQLWGAISAVFDSWQNDRAVAYRSLHGIDEAWGTAVNVQSMVFGNMGDDCATGVAFTRNPSTGEGVFYGEYLMNAQGEDVVAGIRTPQPINEASRTADTEGLATLEEQMPKAYRELVRIQKRLERHYRDMQDIEFTIEEDKLWMLQTRSGKRTTAAAVRIAVDMANERLIKREEAIARVQPSSLDQLLHPTLDRTQPLEVIARGLPASPGAAVGQVVFSAEEAETRSKAGERVVLVRIETSPEDILGMHAAQGILTAKGGMTSHAAVVARGMGKCCVAGCGSLAIDYSANEMRVGEHVIRAGDAITVDGSTGDVILGTVPTVVPELGGAFDELMTWADRFRKLRVRTNADTPQDAEMARRFGAEGIGLCRTEHMFFQPERLLVVQEMILARDEVTREGALAKLLPMQRQDFEGIFRAMAGLPVTVRLLDPPLHEFLPKTKEEIEHVARHTSSEVGEVRAKVDSLHEWNPMLGHRGCRVGITFPEIYRMQVRAITEAACVVASEGIKVKPEIMVPLVAHPMELSLLRSEIETEIAAVRRERPKCRVKPQIGTMIEVPRAALTADVIAEYADFFSFGTNDLTQMGYALSRDDAGGFLADYVERDIMADDPFVSIDEQGIGELVRLGAEKGRSTRPRLKLGICGEHGGDPQSIEFFAGLGFDYVSCSPYRVPVARLAAAQAVVTGRPD